MSVSPSVAKTLRDLARAMDDDLRPVDPAPPEMFDIPTAARKLGISRYAKYRALAWLRGAGIITIKETNTRGSVQVTLLWFP